MRPGPEQPGDLTRCAFRPRSSSKRICGRREIDDTRASLTRFGVGLGEQGGRSRDVEQAADGRGRGDDDDLTSVPIGDDLGGEQHAETSRVEALGISRFTRRNRLTAAIPAANSALLVRSISPDIVSVASPSERFVMMVNRVGFGAAMVVRSSPLVRAACGVADRTRGNSRSIAEPSRPWDAERPSLGMCR